MPDTTHPNPGNLGNLPPETHSFVGRRAELALLRALLDPGGGPAGRLVSVVGVGGVGKTRLALRAAAEVREAYPDGVWLTELSPLHTPGLVDLAVMETLRLADRSTRPVIDVIAEWARGKRLLIVLDSCEHLLADCSRVAAALLSHAPGLRILVTSRERLALPGEEVLHLEPLPVDGGADGSAPAGDAVALFAERAADAGRPLGDDDVAGRAIAAAVCRRLDGIPLALELAAARLADLTLDQLHARLGERLPSLPDVPSPLDLLSSEPGERPPRHQTLRTAIGWSHELCAPLERLLWARLSVFTGGFCAETVQQVCAGGPLAPERIAGLLARLVAQSIVLPDPVISARYRMLDTVREYGTDWLHALGEERAVRRRHREHYARLAHQGCAEWNTGRQVAWCERVLSEHANFRAAVESALAEPDRTVAVEMAGHVGFLWRHCGYLREAQACLDQALAADPPPGHGRTLALWSRGAVAILQGDQEAAANWAIRCADAARDQGSPVALVAAVYVRGGQLALTGRQAEAIDVLAAAPQLPIQDDAFGAAQLQVRLALSLAHVLRGEYGRGREVADEVRTASRKQGEYWCGAFADYLIAQVDLAHGDIPAAVGGARTSIAGHALLHNTVGAAMSLDLLAAAIVTTGDAHRAARLLGIGTRLWELTGRAQMDSPDLIATRRTCELRVRERLGDDAYETGYREGLAMSYDEGIAYASSRSSGH
ncbi:ATP-binding protein [Streptomyces sp. N50]|uniref:ATP-binding protein n=1 Tax=Streptomyces sp. N50 TaxID=3081765 RepID=UPI002962359C|nr:NB-ARC domain-containing protein [Streptomyces sp. N50]WOX09347.1 NB-ARC domain-containing protein [Streptomyces sp. N50]